VKELKGYTSKRTSRRCANGWNPVKELKVETHNPFHVVVLPFVESGEGIESPIGQQRWQVLQLKWNPVKELKVGMPSGRKTTTIVVESGEGIESLPLLSPR